MNDHSGQRGTPHTEQEMIEFKAQFAARRRRQLILTIPFVLLVLVALVVRAGVDLGRYGIKAETFGPVFLVIVIAALIFSFANWRCPACNTYLGRGMNPKFCSRCGTELR
jgi:hypothetical protein